MIVITATNLHLLIGFTKKVIKSLRKITGRKSGGQHGHKGETLKMVDNPQKVIRHKVERCKGCQKDLQDIEPIYVKKRQVFDIPPMVIEVVEHQGEVKRCNSCGTINCADFPEEVRYAVQYGERVKSLIVYFTNYQLLPYERIQQIFVDLFSHSLSQGTIYNTNQICYKELEITEEKIKEGIIKSDVVHFDETGIYSNNKRQWLHSAGTENLTYYAIDEKRGKQAMDRIDILPKFKQTAIHDHWESYIKFDLKHAFCNAHHLRELIYAFEEEKANWADKMKKCLVEIKEDIDKAKEKNKQSLKPITIEAFEQRYDTILEEGLKMYPLDKEIEEGTRKRKKQSKGKNLLDRLRKYKKETLAFMYDFAIPFDNNLVERDIRMMKVKQKISGCFRSEEGARFFCRIRGYISTLKKQRQSVIDALTFVFKGKSLIPIRVEYG